MRKFLIIVGLFLSGAVCMAGQGPAYPYSVNLSWTLSTTPLAQVSGQNVYRAVYSTTCGSYTKITSTLLGNSIVTYTDTTMSNGVAYCYGVTAVGTDGGESALSNIDSNVAIPPAPPTGATVVIAGGPGNYTENLAWTNPTGSLTANTIYFASNINGPYSKFTSFTPRTSFIANVQTAGTYYGIITATGSTGETGPSNQVTIVIP